ncbi:MAG: helix-turn-helix domain-containing protein [bacterium]|jgi:putative transcriptional regulator
MAKKKLKKESEELEFYQIVGNKIQNLRKKFNYSQEKLAQLLSISRQAIAEYEKGAVKIPLYNIYKLCELFKISSIDFFVAEPESIDEEITYYGINLESYNPKGMNYLLKIAEANPDEKNTLRLRALTELYMSQGNKKLIRKLNKDLKECFKSIEIYGDEDYKDTMSDDDLSPIEILDVVTDWFKEHPPTASDYIEIIKAREKLEYILDKAYLLFCAISQKKSDILSDQLVLDSADNPQTIIRNNKKDKNSIKNK